MKIDPTIYVSTLENLTDGIVFLDAVGKIVYWNPGMENLTGFLFKEAARSEGIENFLQLEILQENEDDLDTSFIQSVQTDLRPGEVVLWLKSQSGERVPVIKKDIPVQNSDGDFIGTVQTFRDCRLLYELQSRLREWEKRASIDFLTELPNRSFVELNLRSRMYEYRRNGWPFGVLMLDIDHFKLFNDTHGHDTGDAVLKLVAASLSKHARPYDVIGRWGGEEFMGIVPHVDKLGIYSFSERLRYLVQKTELKTDEKTLRVTVSIGAAIVRPDDDLDSLLKRADRNLYHSKANGRNRTTVD